MTITQQIDAEAKRIAGELGRDWIDCGTYERESYREEARRRVDGEPSRNMDELPDCVWRGAETPFAANH